MAHATPFLSGIRGYPFFNPLLPVIALVQPWHSLSPYEWSRVHGTPWYYLPPPGGHDRTPTAQRIMRALSAVPESPRGIVMSPESTFSYPLRKNDREIEWWRSVLPKNTEYLCGVIEKEKFGLAQSIIKIDSAPIIQAHKKYITIDFFESCHHDLCAHRVLNKIIGWKTGKLRPACEQGAPLMIGGRHTQVLLCSEALWAPRQDAERVVICINETWFPRWIQHLFLAALWWRWCTSRVVVVGHHQSVWW